MRKKLLISAVVSGMALLARSRGAPASVTLPDSAAENRQPAVGSLSVLSLNLGHGRGQASSQWRLSAAGHQGALEQVAALLQREDADVIALQEVDASCWWSGGFNHLERLQGVLGGPASAHGIHARQAGLRYGTALLGQDALTDSVSHTFGAAGFSPRKGVTVARTTLDGRPVDVVSLHLDFALSSVREAQLTELAALLEQRSTPTVLVGDFNMEPHAVERFAQQLSLHTVTPTVTFPRTGGRIDHVLVTGELEITDLAVLPDHVSDHRAVRASVRWRAVEG